MDSDNNHVLNTLLETSTINEQELPEIIAKQKNNISGWGHSIKKINYSVFEGLNQMKVPTPKTVKGFLNLFLTKEFFMFLEKRVNERIKRDETLNNKIKLTCFLELKIYFGIIICMGIIKLPEIKDYWSNEKEFYDIACIRKSMTLKRFTEINSRLSLFKMKGANEEKRGIDKSTEKIIKYLNVLFQTLYDPSEHLSVDEGMVKYTGRYSFKTYMPFKPDKVGMKLYICCDSKNAYVNSFSLHTGSKNTIKNIVTGLLLPFENKNHKVFMDNYYTSTKLFDELLKKQIQCCGTMRLFRGGPDEFVTLKKTLKKHEIVVMQKDQTICLLWHDKKVVCMLNNFLSIDASFVGKSIITKEKNNIIKLYDHYMGGVDQYDQMIKSYFSNRKSLKWTKKLTVYLFNLIIHNSYILYKEFSTEQNKLKSSLCFRKQVVKILLSVENKKSEEEEKNKKVSIYHSPVTFDYNNRKTCVMCLKKLGAVKRTKYGCGGCFNRKGTPSGPHPECFKEYHNALWDDGCSEEDSEN